MLKQVQFNQISIWKIVAFLWLWTFPFGAFLGKIDIGFITIYPSFIFSILLSFYGLVFFKKLPNYFFYFVIYVTLITLIELLRTDFPNLKSWEKMNLKKMVDYILIFLSIGSCSLIYKLEFFKHLGTVAFYWLIFLIVFGLYENFTGFHVSGTFTDLIASIPQSYIAFGSVGIYDNPNDFLVITLLLLLIVWFCIPEIRKIPILVFALLSILFYFSIYAQARTSQVLCLTWMVALLVPELKNFKKNSYEFIKSNFISIGFFLMFAVSVSIGLQFKKGSNSNSVATSEQVISALKVDSIHHVKPKLESSSARIELVKLGVLCFTKHPLIGFGLGGFEEFANIQKVRKQELINPHFYPIEILSLFGLLGIPMILVLLFIWIKHFKLFLTDKTLLTWLIIIPFFAICSLVPSSFLQFELNPFFTAIFLISVLPHKLCQ